MVEVQPADPSALLAAENAQGKPKIVRMASKLAYRNLFHDRLSLIVTLTGIVFSVVLVAVQCGLYIGSETMIAAMLDNSKGDLWVVPFGTKSFDDPSFLIGHEKEAALRSPGIAGAEDLVVGFAGWKKPKGGTTAVLLIGSDHKNGSLKPFNIKQGSIAELAEPFAVAADDTYFNDLGIGKLGDIAEINNVRVLVGAVTHETRSSTPLPYIFTSLQRARQLLDAANTQASYTLVRLSPTAKLESVRTDLSDRLKDREILTQAEFRSR